jgi:hypothetical protein
MSGYLSISSTVLNCAFSLIALVGLDRLEIFYVSRVCTLLKTREVGSWSVKMVLVPCVNIVCK